MMQEAAELLDWRSDAAGDGWEDGGKGCLSLSLSLVGRCLHIEATAVGRI